MQLVLADSEVRADLVVVAAGWETKALVKSFGLALPIICERGYHAMLQVGGDSFTYPVMSGEGVFVLTPMRAGVRLAGMSEFASAKAPPRWGVLDMALRQARELCPGISQRVSSRWVGARPATPDSLPIVCRIPSKHRVIVNAGHGHAGLSLAAVTAQMTVELANGREGGDAT